VAATPINVLIIEDDLDYASLIHVILAEVNPGMWAITHADRLESALVHMSGKRFDVILVDLFLPDCQGLDTFFKVFARSAGVPVVILTVLDDKSAAVRAIREGAQDVLVKSELQVNSLARILQYAVERHRTLETLKKQTLIDELTGLLNRRGFLSSAEQQVKIARRASWESVLVFADLDRLKTINDQHGHAAGDQALVATASILKETFRTSDVIARIGGDEFIILAINASGDSLSNLTHRLTQNIRNFNLQNSGHPLSLSFGVVPIHPWEESSLSQIIEKADQALYRHKRSKTKD
jgi:two-component system, cell cycle response regulator